MPSVPRAFCLMAIAIRFFSARVSLRAASIFKFTSPCSLSASRRFSASVPMPSSLDTCSSLCKLVIESVPMSTWGQDEKTSSYIHVLSVPPRSVSQLQSSFPFEIFRTCVGGCWVAKPRSNLRMKGRAGLERNFFQTSASRLMRQFRTRRKWFNTNVFFVMLKDSVCPAPAVRDLLFGIWDMSLHVVQCTLCDSFLENKIFQLMPIAVVFDSCGDFAEAIQKHFVVRTVLFIVP